MRLSSFRTTRGILLCALAGVAFATVPQGASAALTLGANPVGGTCSSGTLTLLQTSSSESYEAPTAGVITSWSYQGTSTNPATVKLRVARQVGTTANYTTIGQSAAISPIANQLNTNPARIAVEAGDIIGMTGSSSASWSCGNSVSGFNVLRLGADPATGSTDAYPSTSLGIQLNISALLELDADGDGFGDETQDLCATDSTTQAACPGPGPGPDLTAPETQITKRPKAKTKQRRATFGFSSSEQGSSFECSLDGSGFASCVAPFIKTVSKGKHSFTVRAVDAVGNRDATPAVVRWTVKKKKKPKRKGGGK